MTSKFDYAKSFDYALTKLKGEGRYREFADLRRRQGNAQHLADACRAQADRRACR